ncbi:D-2-hydroxyacid dehydrogenase [Sulfurospirillum sp. 1612]|uniref:D-2-hydroxyacid dehydrogenase n=1 Tax=Sulfurospirillum sp. 1612 TaxID=3094835 RepID=UPI002F94732C
MTLSLLDRATLGRVDLSIFDRFGVMKIYESTRLEERIEHIGDSEIVLTNKVVIDKEVMAQCPNLKLICITATGTNNVDLEYAKEHHIVVKNVAGYSTASVAQATFTMALSIIGNSAYYDAYVKSKAWSKSEIFTNFDREFFEIKGKVWGIIGLGNIGKEVAKIASAFGAHVQYYSTSGKNHDSDYPSVDLNGLLTSSDVISIHAPLNPQTENLIQKAELLKMKEGAIILNMGRGGIINEQDLAEVIDTRDIFAGLDVVKTEPIEEDNPLLHIRKQDHIRFAPHTAWASKEARATLIKMVAKNIENFLGENHGKRA